ncbi:transient receptor potential cation channel subfamily M member 1-like [Gastrophryne carolinensis]
MTLSNHAPIVLTLESPTPAPRSWSWRLNNSLLEDQRVVTETQDELRNFCELNSTPGISPGVLWEAHKCFIRGSIIKQGARLKKERTKHTLELLDEIGKLETLHKKSLSAAHLATLTSLREKLKIISCDKIKDQMFKCHRVFFKSGDKCGFAILMSIHFLVLFNNFFKMLLTIMGNTFFEVKSISNQVWKFQRYQLIMTFHDRPVLPPPMIIFSHLYIILKRLCCRCKKIQEGEQDERDRGLKLFLNDEELKKLYEFEEQCVEEYFQEKEDEQQSSNDERIRVTSERVENMAMRLEEVNEREHFMKASLQTVDLRLSQLEELSGRMVNALEKLAGIDKTELIHVRSRASSDVDAAYLLRQGSVNSSDGNSLYKYHVEPEEVTCDDSTGSMSPALGLRKKAYSFGMKTEKGEEYERTQIVPRQTSLRYAASANTVATKDFNKVTLGIVSQTTRPVSCTDSWFPVSDTHNENSESLGGDIGKETDVIMNGQSLAKVTGPDFSNSHLTVERTKLEATISYPLEKSRAARYYPGQSYSTCQTTMTKSRSFIFTQSGKLVNNWTTEYSTVMDQTCSPAIEDWADHWTSESPEIPNIVSEAEMQAELRPLLTDTEDDSDVGEVGNSASYPCTPFPERTETEYLLSVQPDKTCGYASPRSKSLHCDSRKSRSLMNKLERPGHASSVMNIVVSCGSAADDSNANKDNASTETEC